MEADARRREALDFEIWMALKDNASVQQQAPTPGEEEQLREYAQESDKVIAEVLREPQVLRLNQVGELNENVRQQVITADDVAHKEQLLQWLLSNETYTKAIVFTNTRVSADRLTGRLIANQHKVFVLHGEKDQKDRKLAIERLKQGAVKILVATDVAARGLDVEGLDLVINFDMPRSATSTCTASAGPVAPAPRAWRSR